jgi:GntR family transcriptional regulator
MRQCGAVCYRIRPREASCGVNVASGGVSIQPGPVAPWRQLYGLLRGQIEDGTLAPGARLPSLVDLAQTYGVAVTTVRKATDRLKDDGLVVTSPMGTFVAE